MPQRKLDELWKSKTDPPPKRNRVEPKPRKVEIESRSHEIEVKEPKKEKAIEAPCLNAVLGDKSKEKKSILKNVNLIKKNHRESYNKYIWQTTSDPWTVSKKQDGSDSKELNEELVKMKKNVLNWKRVYDDDCEFDEWDMKWRCKFCQNGEAEWAKMNPKTFNTRYITKHIECRDHRDQKGAP